MSGRVILFYKYALYCIDGTVHSTLARVDLWDFTQNTIRMPLCALRRSGAHRSGSPDAAARCRAVSTWVYVPVRPFASVRCCLQRPAPSARGQSQKTRSFQVSQIPQSQFQSGPRCRVAPFILITNATIRPKKVLKSTQKVPNTKSSKTTAPNARRFPYNYYAPEGRPAINRRPAWVRSAWSGMRGACCACAGSRSRCCRRRRCTPPAAR